MSPSSALSVAPLSAVAGLVGAGAGGDVAGLLVLARRGDGLGRSRSAAASAKTDAPSARITVFFIAMFLPEALAGLFSPVPVAFGNFMLLVAQSPCALLVSSGRVDREEGRGEQCCKVEPPDGGTGPRHRAFRRAVRRRRPVGHRRRLPSPEGQPRPLLRHPRGPRGDRRHLGPVPLSRHPLGQRHVHSGLQLPPLGGGQGDRRRALDPALRQRHRRPATASAGTSASATR